MLLLLTCFKATVINYLELYTLYKYPHIYGTIQDPKFILMVVIARSV